MCMVPVDWSGSWSVLKRKTWWPKTSLVSLTTSCWRSGCTNAHPKYDYWSSRLSGMRCSQVWCRAWMCIFSFAICVPTCCMPSEHHQAQGCQQWQTSVWVDYCTVPQLLQDALFTCIGNCSGRSPSPCYQSGSCKCGRWLLYSLLATSVLLAIVHVQVLHLDLCPAILQSFSESNSKQERPLHLK